MCVPYTSEDNSHVGCNPLEVAPGDVRALLLEDVHGMKGVVRVIGDRIGVGELRGDEKAGLKGLANQVLGMPGFAVIAGRVVRVRRAPQGLGDGRRAGQVVDIEVDEVHQSLSSDSAWTVGDTIQAVNWALAGDSGDVGSGLEFDAGEGNWVIVLKDQVLFFRVVGGYRL